MVERLNQSPRYTPQFRREAADRAARFHQAAHHLHEDLSRHPQPNALAQDAEELAAAWQQLQEYVAKLSFPDRAVVTRNYEQLAAGLARLQIIFAY
jgi:hypothetical protein